VKLSVIIPTLNEACNLSAAVGALRSRAILGVSHEIIVADCGSTDGSAELAARLGVRVIEEIPRLDSRAAALNAGAARATGDVLLFLDADTQAPRGYDRAIERALRDSHVVGGAFEFALDGPEFGLRIVELINRMDSRSAVSISTAIRASSCARKCSTGSGAIRAAESWKRRALGYSEWR